MDILGFYGHYGHSNNLQIEFLAILHGLEVIRNSGNWKVVFYSDSIDALSLVIERVSYFRPLATILWDICDLFAKGKSVIFLAYTKGGNKCVNHPGKLRDNIFMGNVCSPPLAF